MPRRLALSSAHAVAASQPAVLLADLLAWDAMLKERGINPGTSADLTVATLIRAPAADHLAVGSQQ